MAVIYFVHNPTTKAIKIGVSAEMKFRMSKMQTDNSERLELLGTIPGSFKEEAAIHERFAEHRRLGEWFDDCQAIRIYLAGLNHGPDPLLTLFLESNVFEPRLCYFISKAVGFAVSIYWVDPLITGKKHKQYQVMRWDERPGKGKAFWSWYVWEMPQFFDSPELAGCEFIRWWQEWLIQGKTVS